MYLRKVLWDKANPKTNINLSNYLNTGNVIFATDNLLKHEKKVNHRYFCLYGSVDAIGCWMLCQYIFFVVTEHRKSRFKVE